MLFKTTTTKNFLYSMLLCYIFFLVFTSMYCGAFNFIIHFFKKRTFVGHSIWLPSWIFGIRCSTSAWWRRWTQDGSRWTTFIVEVAYHVSWLHQLPFNISNSVYMSIHANKTCSDYVSVFPLSVIFYLIQHFSYTSIPVN